MSYLDKLLDGVEVEWKALWEVTIWDKRFNAVDRAKQPKVDNYKYLLAADLFNLDQSSGDVFLLSTGERTGWTTKELAGSYLREGEIVSIPWGKSRPVEDVLKYYKGLFVTADNRIATSSNTDILLNKFLFYWLLTQSTVIDGLYRGSGIQHPNMAAVLDLVIPIPPISVQKEIVRILDTFTELTAELTAELIARKRQYEYYRKQLLSFEEGEVEWKSLRDITSLITKGTTPKQYTESGIAFIKTEAFDGSNINSKRLSFVDEDTHNKELKRSILKHNDILITIAGATIGKCAIVPKEILPANTNQALAIIRLSDDINVKYIFYLLKSNYMTNYIESNIKGSAQPNLNLDQLNNFSIPFPSFEEQARIVSILDKFDMLTTSISEGLPKEIALRKRQYEYYREMLLSFPKNNLVE